MGYVFTEHRATWAVQWPQIEEYIAHVRERGGEVDISIGHQDNITSMIFLNPVWGSKRARSTAQPRVRYVEDTPDIFILGET